MIEVDFVRRARTRLASGPGSVVLPHLIERPGSESVGQIEGQVVLRPLWTFGLHELPQALAKNPRLKGHHHASAGGGATSVVHTASAAHSLRGRTVSQNIEFRPHLGS